MVTADDWTKSAMRDGEVVAELLVRLKKAKVRPVLFSCPTLQWGNRQRRSRKKLIQLDVARVHRSLGALLLLHLLTSTVTRPPMALAHYFPSDLDPRFVVSNYLISACLTSIKIFLFTTNISRFIASSCFVSPTKLKCFDMERVFRSFRQAA